VRETTRHRHAFDAYLRLGAARTLPGLQNSLAEKGRRYGLRTLEEWSRQFHWQQRVDEFEREARLAEDRARVVAIREMSDRQAREALLLQQKGAEWLLQVEDERITPEAAIRAIVEGARLERLARGEPTDRQAIQDETDHRLKGFSDDELERLARAAERGLDRAGDATS